MSFTCSIQEQKVILSWLTCTYHIFHICVDADIHDTFTFLCILRTKTQWRTASGLGDPPFQNAFIAIFSKILHPEQLQSNWLRYSILRDYSRHYFSYDLHFSITQSMSSNCYRLLSRDLTITQFFRSLQDVIAFT